MLGTYRFYQAGSLIAESKNLITDLGSNHIMRYMASQVGVMAGSIAVGAGSAAPQVSDLHLTHEFDRATIYLISPDYINNKIIFKGTIDKRTVGNIYEVGLYNTTFGSSASRALIAFEPTVEEWSTTSFASGNNRIGESALRLTPAANGTQTSTVASSSMDLTDYAGSDRLSFAFHSLNNNTSSVKLRLRTSNTSNYYEYSITPTVGYNVTTFTKSSLSVIGSPRFSEVDSLEVSVSAKSTGAAQVDFDGLRIESGTRDIDNVLISRSVLATPITKVGGIDMDVEYSLTMGIA